MPITQFSQLDLSKTYSYADYLTWQFDELVELIRGRVRRMSPAPRRQHQTVSFNLSAAIKQLLRGKPCQGFAAPFDVRLTRSTPNGDASIETVVQPEICVVCDAQKLDDRGCLGAPDWIIEIVSPGNVMRDIKEKFDLYEEAGVREYWLVLPGEKSVAVYVLEEGRYQPQGEYYTPGTIPVHTLPGAELEWAEVFEGV